MDAENAKEAGKIVVGTETDWTKHVASRDSFLALHVSEDGHMYERLRLASTGDMALYGTNGQNHLSLSAQSGDITADGNVMLNGEAGIFFTDLYSIDQLSNGQLKFSALKTDGQIVLDAGSSGTLSVSARQFNVDLEEELILGSDLRVTGVTRYADGADAFALEQRNLDLFVDAGAAGSMFVSARATTFHGDLVLQTKAGSAASCPGGDASSKVACEGAAASPTGYTYTAAVNPRNTSRLTLASDSDSFRLVNSESKLKWERATASDSFTAYSELVTLDGDGNFQLAQGSLTVAEVFSAESQLNETITRGNMKLLSIGGQAEQASLYVQETTGMCTNGGDPATKTTCEGVPGSLTGNTWTDSTPELRISTAADRGSVIVYPGISDSSRDPASGFFKVRDVFSVQAADGSTAVAGNINIGGLPTSAEDAAATVQSGNANGKSSISFSDGTRTFDMVKSRALLSLHSSDAAGIINIAPGETAGQLQVNFDRLRVNSDTGNIVGRGDLTLGGTRSGNCADDETTSANMDCISPFIYNGASQTGCITVDSVDKCATRVNELNEVTSWGTNCSPCPEGQRTLSVISADGNSVVSISGKQGVNAHGQLRLGTAHTITSIADTLDIVAANSAGTVKFTPGTNGAFKVFGDKFQISGPDGDVVGLGDWSIGDLSVNGAATLTVVSPDAVATLLVKTAASAQQAVATIASGSHSLALSQTDAESLLRGSGTLELKAPAGVLLDSNAAITGSLVFDASASTNNGALAFGADKASLAIASGNLQVVVNSGDLVLTGDNLNFNAGKFSVDGTTGNTAFGGQLSLGLITSNEASLQFTTSHNSFSVTAGAALVMSSSDDAGNIWMKPGSDSGRFKIGDNFITHASTGATEIRGDLTVGQTAGTHVISKLHGNDAASLIIGSASDNVASKILLGREGSSATFEMSQIDGQLSIESAGDAGTVQVKAASVTMNVSGFNINAGDFSITQGTGAFGGNLTVGETSTQEPRLLKVVSPTSSASMEIVAGSSEAASLILTSGAGSSAGVKLEQIGTSLRVQALDATGDITLSPGSAASAKLWLNGNTCIEKDDYAVSFDLSDTSLGPSATFKDGSSSSTISHKNDAMKLSCVDGADGTIALEAGSAFRVNTDKLVIFAATGQVHTAADLSVGSMTSSGTRTLTVQSAADAQLRLEPTGAGDAKVIFGTGNTNVFTVSKVGSTLRMAGAGSSQDIDLVPQGSFTVGGTLFSVAGNSGNIATKGDAIIGCATCTGERKFTVESSDENVILELSPASTSKSATLGLGTGGNRFSFSQSAHTLSLNSASTDAQLNLLPDSSHTGQVTIGDAKFIVNAADGETVMHGDLTVGAVSGARTATIQSTNNAVTMDLQSGSGSTATIKFGEASSSNVFQLAKVDSQTLSLAASGFNSGVLRLEPGSTGRLEVGGTDTNSAALVLDLTASSLAVRSDLTVVGSGNRTFAVSSSSGSASASAEGSTAASLTVSTTGTDAATVGTFSTVDGTASLNVLANGEGKAAATKIQSGSSTSTLSLIPGSLNSAASLQLGTTTEGATLEALGTTLTLTSQHAAGTIKLNPGSSTGVVNMANGLLTVSPAVGSSGTVSTSGDLTVGGALSLSALNLPSGSASGTSGQTINQPSGLLTRTTSSLARASSSSSQVPIETISLTNSKITTSSVVVGSVVSQCNADTVVTIIKISPGAGTVDFTMANVGLGDCANQEYSLSFVVLN
jgi:hypothetical protein